MTTDHKFTDTPRQLYIAGRWVDALDGATFDVTNPADGTALTHVADASAADGLLALDAAVRAQDAWACTPPRQRSEVLTRAWQLTVAHAEELAVLMTQEMGKPLAESRTEVAYGAEFLRWFAEEAVRIGGRLGPNPEGTGTILVSRAPVGPSFFITPWNFPLAMATRKVAPALASGCTVVLKPASLTPLTTLRFVALLEEAGLPPGVVNVVTTSSSGAVSAPIIADPRLRKLSFTGSTSVGRELLRQAAQRVLRVSMELGGNAPFLVFEDADLDAAVSGAMLAKYRNIGQACTAANRFLVHRNVVDDFAHRMAVRTKALTVGQGMDPATDIGPLINEGAVATASDLVADAVARGALVLAGGHALPPPGSYYAPTVLTNVPTGSRILTEEIFGPVVAITPFDTEEEAIAMANDTEYGLVSYAFTQDLARGHRLISRMESGMIGLNTGVVSNAAAPFGGIKQSGIGREGGAEGIDEYLITKYTLIPVS